MKRLRRVLLTNLVLVLALTTAAAGQTAGWPVYGGDPAIRATARSTDQHRQRKGSRSRGAAARLAALQESTPLVIGDTMYVTSSARSTSTRSTPRPAARSGATSRRSRRTSLQYACCDVNNRGVAYANGKIFVGRLDGKLSRSTPRPARSCGRRRWSTTSRARSSPRRRWSSRTRSSPASAAASTACAAHCRPTTEHRQGSLEDLDRARPRRARQRHLEGRLAGSTAAAWPGWSAPTTRRPTPLLGHQQSRRRGTPRCAAPATATTASSPTSTGVARWRSMPTPARSSGRSRPRRHDAWDYDGVNELVLADLKIDGQKTPVMMKADRNGFFYVAQPRDRQARLGRRRSCRQLGHGDRHRHRAPDRGPRQAAAARASRPRTSART